MKILIILAILLTTLVGSGVWWLLNPEDSDDLITSDTGVGGDGPVQSVIDPNLQVDEEPTADILVETDSSSDVPAGETVGEGNMSPFNPVTTPANDAEGLSGQNTATVETGLASTVETPESLSLEQSATSNRPVIVPESYPITDAAKYFIPSSERRSGQLGGPPPLDFSVDDSQGTRGFSPPQAPGNSAQDQ